ncbi:hypothetical protein [Rubellicoccus peritrichatus]|uniref:Cell division protein FtsL n=1 Tax=Rubellicoccus peritrichatus TaxID=3080537 RepID=A0AAQ3QY78_9BACT|nr:hypothetical protein [Puniceicoccus sp. CR14]WOO43545.1 hypothetical protein RZN69_10640 [Puniceicoccus sp. CR14]
MTTAFSRELNLYRFSALALGVLIMAVSAAGALGLVWMRQQISNSAKVTATIEKELHVVERENVRLATHIAKAHNPEVLVARASSDLKPRSSAQVVWMPATGAFPKTFIAETKQRNPDAVSESPLSISFDLALLNARSSTE